jgi:RNA polymerase sigma factor (sigma-70 family)
MSDSIELPRQALSEFPAFYKAEFTRLTFVLIAMGASADQAEDMAQDAMRELLLKWTAVHYPRAFVTTVARRRLSQERKREQAQLEREKRAARPQHLDQSAAIFDAGTQYVMNVLRSLPAKQREVMALKVDGYTPSEIAGITGQLRATVNSHLRHARQTLIQRLIREHSIAAGEEDSDGP